MSMFLLGQKDVPNEKRKDLVNRIVERLKNIKTKDITNSASIELDNLFVIFEPNAARYEFHHLDNRILAGFLHHNFNILFFNYLGYDSEQFNQFSLNVESLGYIQADWQLGLTC